MLKPSIGTLFQMRRAAVDAAAIGGNVVVAGVALSRIVVVQYAIVADEPVYAKWQSDATDLTGPLALGGAGTGIAGTPFALGHFATEAGEPLRLHLSAADIAVGGYVNYWLVQV